MKNNELAIDLAEVLELMLDAVCVVDRDGVFVFVSAAFENMFGYAPSEVIGKSMVDMVYPEDRSLTLGAVESIIAGQAQPRFENRWVCKNGEVVNVLWSARWSEAHQVRIAVAHDITERKRMEVLLEYAAGHDDLTGLVNRTLLLDRLQASINLAEREKFRVSVLFIDIDGFKGINDGYGHAVGDQLLQSIAERLSASVRKSDTVGRLGGDEFIVVLNKTETIESAAVVAKKICYELSRVFNIADCAFQVSSSIGVSCYPENGKVPLELLQSADQAMYQAKKIRGDQVILASG
ncbi:sensor domain-containing diguanylate cyclase [Marinomonas profundimaris]|uniref:Diguanylate cyclase n=1 Tax=Marinomonas profundimaris TaxID=1208321 RepID=W1RPU5_9GAMM|nr:sensor domain-containing diguanylate cyclase [Marinomonas profundimaris]ETI58707.1 diguanylate cyclase [Marinomonas profundimaris]